MWNFDLLPVFASGLLGSCTRTAKNRRALSPAQIKARTEAARREQINQEFIAAVDAGAAGAVVKMLAAGADVNGRDREGMTALMHAALAGNAELTAIAAPQGRSGKPDGPFRSDRPHAGVLGRPYPGS